MKPTYTIIATLALLASAPIFAQDDHQHESGTEASAKQETAKPYPLDTCIVSDEKLGEMGKPASFVYQGQEVKLCCKHCRKDFDKEPAKFMSKLAEKQKAAKP